MITSDVCFVESDCSITSWSRTVSARRYWRRSTGRTCREKWRSCHVTDCMSKTSDTRPAEWVHKPSRVYNLLLDEQAISSYLKILFVCDPNALTDFNQILHTGFSSLLIGKISLKRFKIVNYLNNSVSWTAYQFWKPITPNES